MKDIRQIYEKKQMKLAIFGLLIAFIGAVTNSVFQNFNVAASAQIEGDFEAGVIAAFVLSVTTLGLCEFTGGILTLIWDVTYLKIPAAEIKRTWTVKSGRAVMLSAIIAGPLATGCAVTAISMCGSTYANCIISLAPAVAAILGFVLLKEKVNLRVILGILVCTAGAVIAILAPPEGITNFYVGIIIACICPILYAFEGIISTHGYDCVDPVLACPMYRMIASGIFGIAVSLILCICTGHIGWFGLVFKLIFGSKLCVFFLLCTAIFMFIEYNCTNVSFIYVGAVKGEAILWTGTLWTVPVGFAMEAAGILPYDVTGLGIIGAIVVVVGIMLVVAKPSELFVLRDSKENE